MSEHRHHTTQSNPAYRPEDERAWRGWPLVVVGLIAVGVLAIVLKPVCRPEGATSVEDAGFGVRHEQRGAAWDHCEPWLSRALGN